MTNYTLKDIESFSSQLLHYLKENDFESFDQIFNDPKSSPFLDRENAKIIIDSAFLKLQNDQPGISEAKKTLAFLYSDAQDEILNNTLLPLFIQFLRYGDIQYCEFLIQVAHEKGVSFSFIEAMRVMLKNLVDDLQLDFEEEQVHLELVYKKWVDTLKLLKKNGLDTSYDVSEILSEHEPESKEEEEYLLKVIKLFVDEGFSFQNAVESENPQISNLALNLNLNNSPADEEKVKKNKIG